MLCVDRMLPFWICSTSKIFNTVVDMSEWCKAEKGVDHIFHHHDNFVMNPPDSASCLESLHILESVCAKLGVSLVPDQHFKG